MTKGKCTLIVVHAKIKCYKTINIMKVMDLQVDLIFRIHMMQFCSYLGNHNNYKMIADIQSCSSL